MQLSVKFLRKHPDSHVWEEIPAVAGLYGSWYIVEHKKNTGWSPWITSYPNKDIATKAMIEAHRSPVTEELISALLGFLALVDSHFTKETRDQIPDWFDVCETADKAIKNARKPR